MLAGVESTMMTSASLALRFAVSHPSLVILDLNLPYVNGDEVGVRIRTRYGRTLPIILVTANRHGAEIAEALEAEYLPKPFNVDQLLTVVWRYLEQV